MWRVCCPWLGSVWHGSARICSVWLGSARLGSAWLIRKKNRSTIRSTIRSTTRSTYSYDSVHVFGPRFNPLFGPLFGPRFGPQFGPQFGPRLGPRTWVQQMTRYLVILSLARLDGTYTGELLSKNSMQSFIRYTKSYWIWARPGGAKIGKVYG